MLTQAVLIVEDQAITALHLKCLLQRYGYSHIIIADKGVKAFDLIENEIFSLALLDIKLADDISGIEIAKKLKHKSIPFIFISAFSNPENLKRAKELNPLGIIKKPIIEQTLTDLLNNFNYLSAYI